MTDSKILCTGHEPFDMKFMTWTPPKCKSRPWISRPVRPKYARESERLDSFSAGWPETAEARPRDLAYSGFYFLGRQDICQCFSCGLRLHNWRWGVSPSSVHRRQSPDCKMALGVDAQNVALGEDLGSDGEGSDLADFWSVPQGASAGTDDRDPHVVADGPECSNPDSNYSLLDSPDVVRKPKSQRHRKVKLEDRKEEFRTKAKRLSSFIGCWPKESIVPASELAKVGFYYGGTKDRVICAYCGVILLNFVPGDTAYGEHLKHSGRCAFLKCLSDPKAPRLPEMKDEEDLHPEESDPVESASPTVNDVIRFVEMLGFTRDDIEAALEQINPSMDPIKRVTSAAVLDAIYTTGNTKPKKYEKKTQKHIEMKLLKTENRRLKMKFYGCEEAATWCFLPVATWSAVTSAARSSKTAQSATKAFWSATEHLCTHWQNFNGVSKRLFSPASKQATENRM